ncbi:hypothetical protein [Pedobacter sp. SYSU D00535]|uniref:hypothetical protein n=1 Tax=Pedobacter sp. SYSU D00535 TaxID=2810308 RepID=UPI001A976122|nr:hypothetical protein [Pedobacter sp. SYSU D00535]
MKEAVENLIKTYTTEIEEIRDVLNRMPHGDSRMSQRIQDFERFIKDLNHLAKQQ